MTLTPEILERVLAFALQEDYEGRHGRDDNAAKWLKRRTEYLRDKGYNGPVESMAQIAWETHDWRL